MSREWKPGEVAMDPRYGPVFVVAYSKPWCPAGHSTHPIHVHHSNGDWNTLTDRLAPVVVISPEDREQVERLTKALVEAAFEHGNLPVAHNGIHGDTLQAALREFANPTPPKPDEPQGQFAVVEDRDGARWLLAVEGDLIHPWNRIGTDVWANWSDVAAVRVLSEGVQP